MSDIRLAADVNPPVAQVRAAEITAYDAATTYGIDIGGRRVSVLGQGGTVTTTAVALVAALNASTIPQFAEITWSNNAGTVIGTMDTAGRSITFTSFASGGAGTFAAAADTTANDGAEALTATNCINAATGARALPVNGDTFTFEALTTDLIYQLDTLSGVTVAAFYCEASMEGHVGLEPIDTIGATDYSQHRPRYLKLGMTVAIVGRGDGNGSGLLLLDASSVQTSLEVLHTASADLGGFHACIWKGTHASNAVKVAGDASLDVAPFTGELATILTLTVSDQAQARTSLGTTLGTVIADGESTTEIVSAAALADITAINIHDAATVILVGDNPVTAITLDGLQSTLDCRSSGTISTLNLYEGATLDLELNTVGITVGTINVFGPCTINDPNGKLTVTNPINNWSQVTFNGTPKRGITLGAP